MIPGTVGVIGVGLLGGSLVRALRALHPSPRIVAVEPDPAVRARLIEESLCDTVCAVPDEALREADLVVLATPVAVLEGLLGPTSRCMRDGATLTDVAGVKAPLVAAAGRLVRPAVGFVGAHPMFGGERGGFAASRADRWAGGVVAVCTDGDRAHVERVALFHRALGADVVTCTASEHDAAVAVVSHVPYVLACALAAVGANAGPLAARLAGRGWADSTRLAGFAYDVQGEVVRRNAHVDGALDAVETALSRLRAALADPHDPDGARAAFEAIRQARSGAS